MYHLITWMMQDGILGAQVPFNLLFIYARPKKMLAK